MTSTQRRTAVVLLALCCYSGADIIFGYLRWLRLEEAERIAVARLERVHRQFRVRHAYYHHDLAPRYDGRALYGPLEYAMRTNSLGFRDFDVREVAIRAMSPRILLVGDSFTEGIGIEYGSTFAGRLTKQFGAHGIELLNAGVAAYAPAMYWKKVEFLLERTALQVDSVVIFFDLSDLLEAGDYRISHDGVVVKAQELATLEGWSHMRKQWKHNSLTYQVWNELVRDRGRARLTVSNFTATRRGRANLRYADECMTRLAALLRAHGIPLTIVVYPWAEQLLARDIASVQVRYWRAWAAREQATFIELFEEFFEEADTLGVYQAIERYFIPDDYHWNAEGHRFVAERISARLVPPLSEMARNVLNPK